MKREALAVALASTGLGAAIIVLAGGIRGQDPAATLASTLGLGSGVVLGALLGGLLGAWLVLGGSTRVAATAGFILGVAFLYGAWLLAEPRLWIVDVVMMSVFGEGGELYSGLVLFLIAIPMFRAVSGASRGLVLSLLQRQPQPAA